ncbi:hypothetical protein Gpo141_00014674, partial [Globisporangium polare]
MRLHPTFYVGHLKQLRRAVPVYLELPKPHALILERLESALQAAFKRVVLQIVLLRRKHGFLRPLLRPIGLHPERHQEWRTIVAMARRRSWTRRGTFAGSSSDSLVTKTRLAPRAAVFQRRASITFDGSDISRVTTHGSRVRACSSKSLVWSH